MGPGKEIEGKIYKKTAGAPQRSVMGPHLRKANYDELFKIPFSSQLIQNLSAI